MGTVKAKSLDALIIIGDRVLVKPKSSSDQTASGLYLPPGVQEKEKTQQGYVMKVGPGYAFPNVVESDEVWKKEERVKYVPLQAKVGDLAVYMMRDAIEIEYGAEKYLIVPHNSILMLVRDDGMFDD
ncbi:MAG: co-chaperone GroES family protein [Cytophagaceae bacterium]|jgi:co-chaperonin GroES (HSP10)|nr:co-chaperone GroES family protein [Cytophagaceae bacterium]